MPDFQTILDTAILVLAVPTIITLLAMVIGAACAGANVGRYLINLLISLDQGLNALCGGSPDETISSACYRFGARLPPKSRLWWLAYRGVNGLFFWQADHCRAAYNSERERKHLPPEFQQGVRDADQHFT